MSKKLIIILLNFIAILVITFVVIAQINDYKGLKELCVAKTVIKKGVKITSDMVETKKVTVNKEDKGNSSKRVTYYNDVYVNLKDIVGKYATYDMVAGEIIIKEKVADKISGSDQYLTTLPKGYYPYILDLDKTAMLIKVNDWVDLYVYVKGTGFVEEASLRHLRVYGLKSEGGASMDGVTRNDKGEYSTPKYAVVALNNYQLTRLLTYQHTGAIITYGLRKRPASELEVYDYPDLAYPIFAINDTEIIDDVKEQDLIAKNKIKVENEKIDNMGLPSTKQSTGTGTATGSTQATTTGTGTSTNQTTPTGQTGTTGTSSTTPTGTTSGNTAATTGTTPNSTATGTGTTQTGQTTNR